MIMWDVKAELHMHTKMSKMRGLIAPKELVEFAIENKYKAVAVTDIGSVQAFPEVYETWKKYYREYEEDCLRKGEVVRDDLFPKIIYGAEVYLSDYFGQGEFTNNSDSDPQMYPILLYARNEAGIMDLYKLISSSGRCEKNDELTVDKSHLQSIRENLLVGAVCDGGELSEGVNNGKPASELKKIASFYDFLEITPDCTYEIFADSEKGIYRTDDEKKIILQCIYSTGKELNIPVIMTSDAYYTNPEDKDCYDILLEADQACKQTHQRPAHIKKSIEFSHTISAACDGENIDEAEKYLRSSMERILDMTKQVSPLREGRFLPVYPNAERSLMRHCYEKAYELYGSVLPEVVQKRLEEETDAICRNGYAGIYMFWRKLVKKSLMDGYPVGIRGSVGASFTAYLLGITITNPLGAHYRCEKCCYSSFEFESEIVGFIGADLPEKTCPVCGEKLLRDGYSIPHETFMGSCLDKEPDIDVNFAYNEQPVIQKYVSSLPGVGSVCKAGTIGTLVEHTAERIIKKYYISLGSGMPQKYRIDEMSRKLSGVRRVNGQHPGGVIVVPEGEELTSFTPVNKVDGETEATHFDFHAIGDNLLRLDILGHGDPEMLHELHQMTGVDPLDIPINDEKVISLFLGVGALGISPEKIGGETLGLLGIPEFGGKYARDMIRSIRPKSVTALVKISGLLHGTNTWEGNAKERIEFGTATIDNCIGSRDDIFQYLLSCGFEKDEAFLIMDSVRKGHGLTKEWQSEMREKNIPDWYIESCKKIRYLFPKSHAASYTKLALLIAWYKVYYPSEFYTVWLKRNEGNKAEMEYLYVLQEMYARGIRNS